MICQAVRWDGTAPGATEVVAWIMLNHGAASYRDDPPGRGSITVAVPDGREVLVVAGDWVIRDGLRLVLALPVTVIATAAGL